MPGSRDHRNQGAGATLSTASKGGPTPSGSLGEVVETVSVGFTNPGPCNSYHRYIVVDARGER